MLCRRRRSLRIIPNFWSPRRSFKLPSYLSSVINYCVSFINTHFQKNLWSLTMVVLLQQIVLKTLTVSLISYLVLLNNILLIVFWAMQGDGVAAGARVSLYRLRFRLSPPLTLPFLSPQNKWFKSPTTPRSMRNIYLIWTLFEEVNTSSSIFPLWASSPLPPPITCLWTP